MSHSERIVKNYYLKNDHGRASIWTLWLTPVPSGENNIYFSGSGYRRANKCENGFRFHLSIHRNNYAHIKHDNSKIHRFRLTNPKNFPIASIYTNSEDLTVPMEIPANLTGDIFPIESTCIKNDNNYCWIELLFVHLEEVNVPKFKHDFCGDEYECQVIDETDIGQNRKILVLGRYVTDPSLIGMDFDKEITDSRQRLTVWGHNNDNSNHVSVYDFPADSLDSMRSILK